MEFLRPTILGLDGVSSLDQDDSQVKQHFIMEKLLKYDLRKLANCLNFVTVLSGFQKKIKGFTSNCVFPFFSYSETVFWIDTNPLIELTYCHRLPIIKMT